MKIKELLEQEEKESIDIRLIKKADSNYIDDFVNFYNNNSMVTKKLTTQKLKSSLASKGRLWGIYTESDKLVATIGVTHSKVNGYDVGEMGYFFIEKGYRTLSNLLVLFKKVIKYAKLFDIVVLTTNKKSKPMNRIMSRFPKVSMAFEIKSKTTPGIFVLWMVDTPTSITPEQKLEVIKNKYSDVIVKEV